MTVANELVRKFKIADIKDGKLANPRGLEDLRTFWENPRESGGPADSADPIQEDRN